MPVFANFSMNRTFGDVHFLSYIDGEVLSYWTPIGKSMYGTNVTIKTQYWNEYEFLGFEVSVPAPIKNHEMNAFKKAWGLEDKKI